MQIWLLMQLVCKKALKGMDLKLIMKPSLLENLHSELVKDARFKAFLVAKGHTQKGGVDFNEMFSLVVKHSSTRLEKHDVKVTFLHGELEE
ncbi:hypothetical protein AAG906_038399 [Vitis piasezkii]